MIEDPADLTEQMDRGAALAAAAEAMRELEEAASAARRRWQDLAVEAVDAGMSAAMIADWSDASSRAVYRALASAFPRSDQP
jgi:hypothetical protein